MNEFIKYPDGTLITYSNIRKKENGDEYLIVCFERPGKNGLDTVVFELPSYKIIINEGEYSEQEIAEFKKVVELGAPFFFNESEEGKKIA